MGKRTVITIGRQFGSGGHDIGKKLADHLGVAFYDKELLEVASEESGISKELFEQNDEMPTSSLLYSISVNPYSIANTVGVKNIPINQQLFLAQFQAIQKIAREQDCVIVGRCADYALRDQVPYLNVFIYAPLQYRIGRVKELNELSSNEAKDLILKTDKRRAAYYNSYSDHKWGQSMSYHLSFDSSQLSMDDAVALIELYLKGMAGAAMRLVIDRFEGIYAVCEREDGGMERLEREFLPAAALEGDVIDDESGVWQVDMQGTARRRALMREKLQSLWDEG